MPVVDLLIHKFLSLSMHRSLPSLPTQNRLEELKLHEENRRKEAMRSRQIAERLGVEEAHMLEFQQVRMGCGNVMHW